MPRLYILLVHLETLADGVDRLWDFSRLGVGVCEVVEGCGGGCDGGGECEVVEGLGLVVCSFVRGYVFLWLASEWMKE